MFQGIYFSLSFCCLTDNSRRRCKLLDYSAIDRSTPGCQKEPILRSEAGQLLKYLQSLVMATMPSGIMIWERRSNKVCSLYHREWGVCCLEEKKRQLFGGGGLLFFPSWARRLTSSTTTTTYCFFAPDSYLWWNLSMLLLLCLCWISWQFPLQLEFR